MADNLICEFNDASINKVAFKDVEVNDDGDTAPRLELGVVVQVDRDTARQLGEELHEAFYRESDAGVAKQNISRATVTTHLQRANRAQIALNAQPRGHSEPVQPVNVEAWFDGKVDAVRKKGGASEMHPQINARLLVQRTPEILLFVHSAFTLPLKFTAVYDQELELKRLREKVKSEEILLAKKTADEEAASFLTGGAGGREKDEPAEDLSADELIAAAEKNVTG